MDFVERPGKQTTFEADMIEGFFIVRSLLSGIVNPHRITYRDTQSYMGILLDNDTRKPLVRLYFNRSQKHLGIFDENRQEERVLIDKLNEIYQYSEKIRRVFAFYEAEDDGKE